MKIETMIELISLAVTSCVTISAVFITAAISRKADVRNHARAFLTDAFGDVLKAYAAWLDTRSRHEVSLLYAAAERARLLCSDTTEALLRELEQKVSGNHSAESCARTVAPLRKSMCAELESLERKPKRDRNGGQRSDRPNKQP